MKGIAAAVIGSMIISSCTIYKPVTHEYILTPTHIYIVGDSTCSPKEIF